MVFTFNCQGRCPKCGAEHFVSPYNPAEFTPVTCVGCGEVTTVRIAINALDVFDAQEPDVGTNTTL